MRRILIDSGILLSYYQQQEPLHQAVVAFFDQNAAQLITSPICIAEVLWLLGNPSDPRVLAAQNHLLGAVSRGGIEAINLLPEDYARSAELNKRYADLPGDFADLTLVTLSERLEIAEILSLEATLISIGASGVSLSAGFPCREPRGTGRHQPAQISSSSSASPANWASPSSRVAASIRRGWAWGSANSSHTSTALSSGINSQPRRAPLR
jgi:predicted nucleic acid-binding protein